MHPRSRHSTTSLSARAASSGAGTAGGQGSVLRPAGRPRPRTTLDALGTTGAAQAQGEQSSLMGAGVHTILPASPGPRERGAALNGVGGARPVWSNAFQPSPSPPLPAVQTRFKDSASSAAASSYSAAASSSSISPASHSRSKRPAPVADGGSGGSFGAVTPARAGDAAKPASSGSNALAEALALSASTLQLHLGSPPPSLGNSNPRGRGSRANLANGSGQLQQQPQQAPQTLGARQGGTTLFASHGTPAPPKRHHNNVLQRQAAASGAASSSAAASAPLSLAPSIPSAAAAPLPGGGDGGDSLDLLPQARSLTLAARAAPPSKPSSLPAAALQRSPASTNAVSPSEETAPRVIGQRKRGGGTQMTHVGSRASLSPEMPSTTDSPEQRRSQRNIPSPEQRAARRQFHAAGAPVVPSLALPSAAAPSVAHVAAASSASPPSGVSPPSVPASAASVSPSDAAATAAAAVHSDGTAGDEDEEEQLVQETLAGDGDGGSLTARTDTSQSLEGSSSGALHHQGVAEVQGSFEGDMYDHLRHQQPQHAHTQPSQPQQQHQQQEQEEQHQHDDTAFSDAPPTDDSTSTHDDDSAHNSFDIPSALSPEFVPSRGRGAATAAATGTLASAAPPPLPADQEQVWERTAGLLDEAEQQQHSPMSAAAAPQSPPQTVSLPHSPPHAVPQQPQQPLQQQLQHQSPPAAFSSPDVSPPRPVTPPMPFSSSSPWRSDDTSPPSASLGLTRIPGHHHQQHRGRVSAASLRPFTPHVAPVASSPSSSAAQSPRSTPTPGGAKQSQQRALAPRASPNQRAAAGAQKGSKSSVAQQQRGGKALRNGVSGGRKGVSGTASAQSDSALVPSPSPPAPVSVVAPAPAPVDDEVSLMYDPVLKSYYDPNTAIYYEQR